MSAQRLSSPSLEVTDPDVAELIEAEIARQSETICLIPSENYVSRAVLKAMGSEGRVVGVDIEIRPGNRRAIETHELASYITLIEGDSAAPDVVNRARGVLRPGDKVLVILDSNHTKAHVAKELEAYAPLVTLGSYIAATDGIMGLVHDTPRGRPEWVSDNPTQAASEFAARHSDFVLEEPKWRFNESELDRTITAWPGAWLKRIR